MIFEFDYNGRLKTTNRKMMNLFNQVTAFRDIWNHDKSKDKKAANEMLRYVFFVSDITIRNTYRDIMDFTERSLAAKYEVYGDKSKKFTLAQQKLVDEAIKSYNLVNTTESERALYTIDVQVKKIREKLATQEPKFEENTNETTGITSFTSNVKLIKEAANSITDLLKIRDSIHKMIIGEAALTKTRGGMARSPMEKGVFNIDWSTVDKDVPEVNEE